MHIAIVADTPYQVMNAINLKTCNRLFLNESVDLFLGHQFKSSKKISNLIREKNIFTNVYDFYPPLSSKKRNILYRILEVLYPEYGLNKLLKSSKSNDFRNKYNIILFSILTEMSKLLLLSNYNADVYMFDDGIGSYSRNLNPNSVIPPKRLFLYRLLGLNIANPNIIKGLFLNNPKLYCGNEFNNIFCIRDNGNDNTKILNDIFNGSDSKKYLANNIIYFTAPDNDVDFNICNYITENIDKVLIRFHPRQNTESYQMYNGDKDYGDGLWELICSSYITDDYILIGLYSTAQLTPFMLFEKQPYLIFTYKLFEDGITNELKEAIEKMIDIIRKKYSDKDKICIVNTKKEIIDLIKSISGGT